MWEETEGYLRAGIGGQSWRQEAICLGSAPDVWFPGKGSLDRIEEARQICFQCPVQEPCLEYALSLSEDLVVGIWGGTTPRERRIMRRRVRTNVA
jgi:WhiB family transcriptional regulator, redox-sensing transcriptional regulator